MKHKINVKYHNILLIASILAIIPVLLLCFYDRPCADDFSYSISTHASFLRKENIFTIIKFAVDHAKTKYCQSNGSFITSIIQSLQTGIFGGAYYAICPLIIIIWMFLCIRYLIGTINDFYIKEKKISSYVLALWILSFIILWIPSITEGIYWFNGAVNYMISLFALMMNIGLFIKIFKCKRKKVYIILSCLLSILCAEGNVLVSFTSAVILFILTVLFIIKKSYYHIIPYIICFIRFLFNVFSPGIFNRANSLSVSSIDYISVVKQSFSFSKDYILSDIDLILILFLFTLTPYMIRIIKNSTCKISVKKILIIYLLSFLILTAISCVPIAANAFAYRVINVIWIIFVLLCIIDYYCLIKILHQNNILCFDNISKSIKIIVTIIFCFIIIYGTSSGKYHERSAYILTADEIKSGVAFAYAQEIDEREKIFINSKNKSVVVEPLYSISDILCFEDITEDKNYWVNTSVAKYFDLVSVYTGY